MKAIASEILSVSSRGRCYAPQQLCGSQRTQCVIHARRRRSSHHGWKATKSSPLLLAEAMIRPSPNLHASKRHLSSVRFGNSSPSVNGAAVFIVILFAVSDPVISSFESLSEDVNNSYWMQQNISPDDQGAENKSQSRLRNPHKHSADNDSSLDIPNYSRIVIVGGGMAGLHTALALAEQLSDRNVQDSNFSTQKNRIVRDIVVLDGTKIGNGASGRAKGLVVPGVQVPLENLKENASDTTGSSGGWTIPGIVRSLANHPRYTTAVVEEIYDLSYVALARLRSIVNRHEIDCDWVESGALEGSIHPMEEEEDEEVVDDGCQILTSEQVDKIIGRPSDSGKSLYKWGEYDPSCAAVDPLALTNGLADAAERLGVKIYEYTKVVKLETRSSPRTSTPDIQREGKYTVVTGGGHSIGADHVVLCTGAGSIPVAVSRRLSRSFVPFYTWMAATEPLHENCPLKSTKESPAPMCGDDHIALNYWRNNNKDDGRLLFGSLADTFSFPQWLISWRLKNALTEIYPQLKSVQFDQVWGGKLCLPLNAMPLIGRDTDYDADEDESNADITKDTTTFAAGGVWYATGFAGHGIVPTAMAGSLLADAILGNPDKQQWQLFQTFFSPLSWNGYPFSRVGAGLVLLVYNTWDWLGKRGVPVPALPKPW
ncbi:hypothetical protein ACHAWF_008095 [Thalassiosira exigua]